jgi:hypothetical protein
MYEVRNSTMALLRSKSPGSGVMASTKVIRRPHGVRRYPADAARVKVCEYALTSDQAASAEVKGLLADWEQYAEVDNADTFYREACSEKLLRRFTTVILNLLGRLMPGTPRNVSLLPNIDTILGPYDTVTFEDVTQRAITVLMKRADIYDSWWREARDKIV